MNNVNQNAIKQLDSKNMLGSIELLDKQVEEVWKLSKTIKIPASYKKAKNIVVAGMGGSALPARVIKSVFKNDLKIPVEIVNDYSLPGFAVRDTVVILSSYSGSTEEVLGAAKECKKKKIKTIVITSGKDLAKLVKSGVPGLVFTPNYNPCNSPRMGLGYNFFGQIALFNLLGLIQVGDKEINSALQVIKKYNVLFGVANANNPAERTAAALNNRLVLFIASGHLVGSAHAAANQMNENNKRMAVSFAIPELNHHLMEGMKLPDSNKENLLAVLFNSRLYSRPVQKRFEVTKEILAQNGIQWAEYVLAENSRLNQACEALVFSSYLSFYGAILSNLDPTAIPYVDYFKAQLKK